MAEKLTELRRALLRRPLITQATDPMLYRDIAGRHDQLARWYRNRAGWTLVHDPTDAVIRLAISDPAVRRGQVLEAADTQPRLGRLGWTLAMLCCAAMAESDRADVFASDLRDTVAAYTTADPDLPDIDLTDDNTARRALANALGWLSRIGVVVFRDGTADDVRDGNEAIISIRAAALRELLTSPTSPIAAQHPDDLVVDPTATLTGRGPDVTVTRRLLLAHALYDTDLTDAERHWLRSNPSASFPQLRRLAADVGCELERRTDGVALIDTDPAAPLAPLAFPAAGSTATHVALILAEHLADQLRATPHQPAVPLAALTAIVADAATVLGAASRWAEPARNPDNAPATLAAALSVLDTFDLIDRHADTVTGRPLIARFGAQPVHLTDQPPTTLPLELS